MTEFNQARRRFLRSAPIGTLAALGLSSSTESAAQTQLSPDDALRELMRGNQRFMAGRLTVHDRDLAILRRHTIDTQEPFAAVLSCSDSRVPAELIFD